MRRQFISASVLLFAACQASAPGGGTDKYPDAGVATIDPPQVMGPAETPLAKVALRGSTTEATRIVVKHDDSTSSMVASLLPGGSFCVDAPLTAGATTKFQLFAVAEDGRISMPAKIDVKQNAAAVAPDMPTCNDAVQCTATEICDNNEDDDCNGFKDKCDPACNGCSDDYLEPNDTPFEVPILAAGNYDNLSICPCREDWYSIPVLAGGSIGAIVNFDSSQIDIDIKLYKAADAENGSDTPVASSIGTTSTEEFTYPVVADGAYYLRVFAFSADQSSGTYSLQLTY